MTEPQIRLTGHMDVPEDLRAAVAGALLEHIRLTRNEPGCLSFEVSPHPSVPGRYVVAELFATRQDFEAHRSRVQASDWGRITAGVPRDYQVTEVTA